MVARMDGSARAGLRRTGLWRIIRAAVVGLGRIAWTLEDDPKRDHPCTHAGALAQLPGVELVAGAARSEKSAKAFQERFHTKKAYTDYLEMVREEKIDIVGVATNPETHAQIVVDLATRGSRAFCVKSPSRFRSRMRTVCSRPARITALCS